MAQNTPAQLGAARIPMMDGAMLDARTRPSGGEPAPIWLRHRLQRRRAQELSPPRRSAREWLDRLSRRPRN